MIRNNDELHTNIAWMLLVELKCLNSDVQAFIEKPEYFFQEIVRPRMDI